MDGYVIVEFSFFFDMELFMVCFWIKLLLYFGLLVLIIILLFYFIIDYGKVFYLEIKGIMINVDIDD